MVVIVTGIPVLTQSEYPVRREIRKLQKNDPDQWNLYLLGLSRFQQTGEHDVRSYYQISGIHGRPYSAWDGVAGVSGNLNTGYCTHSSILFMTWHRPYLALFEQELYNKIQDVASEFPDGIRSRYVDAGKNFRIPFWDWSLPVQKEEHVYPMSIFGEENATITDIDGTQKTISNPLFSYQFHPINPNANDFPCAPWNAWQNTLRYPSCTNPCAHSQNDKVVVSFDDCGQGIRDSVILIMLSYHDFAAFSNDKWDSNDDKGTYGSLENIHNTVHDLIGGDGHMSQIPYSAFDPIFWLHHVNVDRLFALWQDMNSDSYVVAEETEYGTYTTEKGSTEDETSPLEPFMKDTNRNFYTSDDIRNTTTFGYAYTEKKTGNQSEAARAILQKYGYGSPWHMILGNHRGFGFGTAPGGNDLSHLAPQGKYNEWIVNLRAQKHGLGQTFRVHVFLGHPGSNPAEWRFHNNLVGTFSVLGNPPDTGCGKCQQDANNGLIVTGIVPLTSALIRIIAGDHYAPPLDLSHDLVVNFLKDNLQWRVALFDGSEKQANEVPDLLVAVVSTEVQIGYDGDRLPVYSGLYREHKDATHGKLGGLSY